MSNMVATRNEDCTHHMKNKNQDFEPTRELMSSVTLPNFISLPPILKAVNRFEDFEGHRLRQRLLVKISKNPAPCDLWSDV